MEHLFLNGFIINLMEQVMEIYPLIKPIQIYFMQE